MDKDKENVDNHNLSGEIVKSSQGSPLVSNTQALHLELLDESDDNKILTTQPSQDLLSEPSEMPSIGSSPSSDTMKRPATAALTDIDDQQPSKMAKTEESKEVEVVTLGDSLNESSETFSLSGNREADVSRQSTGGIADDSVIVVEPPQDDTIPTKETITLTDESSPAMGHYPETSTPTVDCTDAKNEKSTARLIDNTGPQESPLSQKATVPLETTEFDQNLKKDTDDKASKERQNEGDTDDEKDITPLMSTPDDAGGYVMIAMKEADFKRLKDHQIEYQGNWKYFGDLGEVEARLKNKSSGVTKRLSTFSSLSGTSSGYNADSSSGISSEGSKRDRLSILPEANIAPHNVLSPLPKPSFLKPKAQRKTLPQPELLAPKKDLEVGTRVFAKWVEKTRVKYWPGKIEKIEEDQKYMILFDDDYRKLLKKEDIWPADGLVPGNHVHVVNMEDPATHKSGTILSFADLTTPGKIFYEVQKKSKSLFDTLTLFDFQIQLESATEADPEKSEANPEKPEADPEKPEGDPEEPVKKISHEWIFMEPQQWQGVTGGFPGTPKAKLANVSLDNLVTGKRRSKPVTPMKDTPTTSKTPKKRGAAGSNVETSAAEDCSSKNMSVKKKLRKRATDKRNTDLPLTTDDEERLGQSGSKKSNLFKGLFFMITQGTKGNLDESDLSMDSETEEEDAADNLKEEVLDKKSLRKKIIEHGGTVLAKFPDQTKEKISSNIIVVTDRMCRTLTYLSAIAFGFERINFTWILNCISAGKLMIRKNYALQVGYSNVLQRDIEPHEVSSVNLRELFKGDHFVVASTNADFTSAWKELLLRVGAEVTIKHGGKLNRLKKFNAIITQSQNCPDTIRTDANERDKYLVSTAWILECLINGRKLTFNDYLIL